MVQAAQTDYKGIIYAMSQFLWGDDDRQNQMHWIRMVKNVCTQEAKRDGL
jgi:nitric oxide reductase large subunit